MSTLNIVRKMAKIMTLIFTCLIFIVLIFAMYTKVKMMITKQDYPTLFGYTFFQVASGSMEPAMSVNDLILVRLTDNIKENDIVSYNYNGTIITHRVISSNGQNVILKGDANNAADAPIQRSDIIGKVVNIYPGLAMWLEILSQPHIIFLAFVTLLLFDFAFSYKPKKKKEEKIVKVNPQPNEIIKEKDVILDEDLMDLTQQINIEELNEILKQEKMKVHDESKEFVEPQEIQQDYTVRLDLKQIQQNISNNIK